MTASKLSYSSSACTMEFITGDYKMDCSFSFIALGVSDILLATTRTGMTDTPSLEFGGLICGSFFFLIVQVILLCITASH